MDKVDEVYLQEVLRSQGTEEGNQGSSSSSSSSKKSKFDVQVIDSEGFTYDELLDMVNDINKGDAEHDLKVVSGFIKVMLKFWGEELNARDNEVKMSVKGKIESGIYAQTR